MADNITRSDGKVVATDDISGAHYQRMKMTHGADGSATDVSSASPMPIDSELPTAAALADGASNPTAPTIGVGGLVYNGATWDRVRGAHRRALLASAARTATTTSTDQTTDNITRGVLITLAITVQGTGSLRLSYQHRALTGGSITPFVNTTFSTSVLGTYSLLVYPGVDPNYENFASDGGVSWIVSMPLSGHWRVAVTHTDASSWTYSVDAMTLA